MGIKHSANVHLILKDSCPCVPKLLPTPPFSSSRNRDRGGVVGQGQSESNELLCLIRQEGSLLACGVSALKSHCRGSTSAPRRLITIDTNYHLGTNDSARPEIIPKQMLNAGTMRLIKAGCLKSAHSLSFYRFKYEE